MKNLLDLIEHFISYKLILYKELKKKIKIKIFSFLLFSFKFQKFLFSIFPNTPFKVLLIYDKKSLISLQYLMVTHCYCVRITSLIQLTNHVKAILLYKIVIREYFIKYLSLTNTFFFHHLLYYLSCLCFSFVYLFSLCMSSKVEVAH